MMEGAASRLWWWMLVMVVVMVTAVAAGEGEVGGCACHMLVLRCALLRAGASSSSSLSLRVALDRPSFSCGPFSESFVALNLVDNALPALDFPPAFFSRHPSLAYVWADGNRLRSLDGGLSAWSGARHLSVARNQLTRVERWLWPRLETLAVNDNVLRDLDLASATRLRVLRADRNMLQRVVAPEEGKCALTHLSLRENTLRELPWQLEGCFATLTHVDVARNQLTAFHLPAPTATVQRLLLQRHNHHNHQQQQQQQPTLGDHILLRSNNKTSTSTCSLRTLDVSHNNLSHVTDALAWCRDLRLVNASANRLRRVPMGMLLLMVLRPQEQPWLNADGVVVDLRGNPLDAAAVHDDFTRFLSAGYAFTKIHHRHHHHDTTTTTTTTTTSTVAPPAGNNNKPQPQQQKRAWGALGGRGRRAAAAEEKEKEEECECATFRRLHFAPVTYCISSMCTASGSAWQQVLPLP